MPCRKVRHTCILLPSARKLDCSILRRLEVGFDGVDAKPANRGCRLVTRAFNLTSREALSDQHDPHLHRNHGFRIRFGRRYVFHPAPIPCGGSERRGGGPEVAAEQGRAMTATKRQRHAQPRTRPRRPRNESQKIRRAQSHAMKSFRTASAPISRPRPPAQCLRCSKPLRIACTHTLRP